ncbi:hypothetical protein [Georgenia sp. SUBG003]|uniref:hypothetical protein n=1 Tax=Georgenia sp. SUBG003 TaxID=1497974 RepID=UPI003AB230EC
MSGGLRRGRAPMWLADHARRTTMTDRAEIALTTLAVLAALEEAFRDVVQR